MPAANRPATTRRGRSSSTAPRTARCPGRGRARTAPGRSSRPCLTPSAGEAAASVPTLVSQHLVAGLARRAPWPSRCRPSRTGCCRRSPAGTRAAHSPGSASRRGTAARGRAGGERARAPGVVAVPRPQEVVDHGLLLGVRCGRRRRYRGTRRSDGRRCRGAWARTNATAPPAAINRTTTAASPYRSHRREPGLGMLSMLATGHYGTRWEETMTMSEFLPEPLVRLYALPVGTTAGRATLG